MRLVLNGEERTVTEGLVVEQLIAELKLSPATLAVEVNKRIVRRAEWSKKRLEEGDRVEIVHLVGGGAAKDESEQE